MLRRPRRDSGLSHKAVEDTQSFELKNKKKVEIRLCHQLLFHYKCSLLYHLQYCHLVRIRTVPENCHGTERWQRDQESWASGRPPVGCGW